MSAAHRAKCNDNRSESRSIVIVPLGAMAYKRGTNSEVAAWPGLRKKSSTGVIEI